MSSQAFLWLNFGFVGLMGVLFYLGRARIKDPSRLRLRSGVSGSRSVVAQNGRGLSRETVRESHESIKNLNVIFMYNGHSWDAHEVLGVPAGANSEMLKSAYREALEKSQSDGRAFIEAAYRAILADIAS